MLIWTLLEQGTTVHVLAVGAGGACFDILIFFFSRLRFLFYFSRPLS